MDQLSDSGQVGALSQLEITVTAESFALAYDVWRDQLLDEAIDGLPVAPASSESLFQTLS